VLDFTETFAPIARLEAIRIMLSFTTQNKIKLYQMDGNSASVCLLDLIDSFLFHVGEIFN